MADQLSREDLKTMTPQEIEDARKAGRLDDLIAGRTPKADGDDTDETLAVLASLPRENIDALIRERHGHIDQGARGREKVGQLGRGDLANMSASQISRALAEGRLDDVLSGRR